MSRNMIESLGNINQTHSQNLFRKRDAFLLGASSSRRHLIGEGAKRAVLSYHSEACIVPTPVTLFDAENVGVPQSNHELILDVGCLV